MAGRKKKDLVSEEKGMKIVATVCPLVCVDGSDS
jgi:hypothetical protein